MAVVNGTGVKTSINYLIEASGKPTTYVCDPPPGVPKHNARYGPYEALVQDARPVRAHLSLEREGFVLADHRSAVGDFWNDDEVDRVYRREVEQLVRRETGARETLAFDFTRRRRSAERMPLDGNRLTFSSIREPVGKAHTDFTERSAVARLELELGPRAAELRQRRFAIVNVWRPLNGEPIEDAPLALLDARSLLPEHLVASDLVYSDRVGETYNLRHDPAHRWFYFRRQSRAEAILFKNFDTHGGTRFTPHTAFEDPTASSEAPLRESIEARVFAFY